MSVSVFVITGVIVVVVGAAVVVDFAGVVMLPAGCLAQVLVTAVQVGRGEGRAG